MELKEYLISKGFDMKDVNNHFMHSDPIRARQVDDLGFIMASKVNHHLQDLKKSFTVDNGILKLDKNAPKITESLTKKPTEVSQARLLSLPWNQVVKNGTCHEGSTSRVSALHPTRLLLNDANRSSSPALSLSFKPTTVDHSGSEDPKRIAIAPPMNFLQEARKLWDSSLVAYFASASLTFERTRASLFKLWGSMGLRKVFYNAKGFYTLKFDTVKEMEAVLNLGSIIIDRKKLYLRPWMEGTHFQKDKLTSVPIWLKFVNVPHSYWSVEGLSYIASAIGVPISLDSPTSNMEPMKFARICVSLKYDSKRPSEIIVPVLSDEDGSMVMDRVQVEYPTLPPNCSHCRCFGHSLAKCSMYRLSMDVGDQSANTLGNAPLVNVGRRSGKEPMECSILQTNAEALSLNQSTSAMINFVNENMMNVSKNVSSEPMKVSSVNPMMVNSVVTVAPVVAMNVTPNYQNNDSPTITQSTVNCLEKVITPTTSCKSWSLGSAMVVNSGGFLNKNAGVNGKKVVGPITIEFGPPNAGMSHSSAAQKTKRKKRTTKKGSACQNLNDEPMHIQVLGRPQNPNPATVINNDSAEGSVGIQPGGVLNMETTSQVDASTAEQGFIRVTRRTANKKTLLVGKPATNFQ